MPTVENEGLSTPLLSPVDAAVSDLPIRGDASVQATLSPRRSRESTQNLSRRVLLCPLAAAVVFSCSLLLVLAYETLPIVRGCVAGVGASQTVCALRVALPFAALALSVPLATAVLFPPKETSDAPLPARSRKQNVSLAISALGTIALPPILIVSRLSVELSAIIAAGFAGLATLVGTVVLGASQPRKLLVALLDRLADVADALILSVIFISGCSAANAMLSTVKTSTLLTSVVVASIFFESALFSRSPIRGTLLSW